jgi:hypothetical protein
VSRLLLSEKNSVEATGQSFRFWREHAPSLGVPVVKIGRKAFIDAEALLSAIRARAAEAAESTDPAEAVRKLIGLGGKR